MALIGTLVVWLTYWAGTRFYERRVGLVAAAVMAVAFLPVFYSKHALNDVVTLAPITVALVASLLIYQRAAWTDWALAGAAVGVATATKYTAGAMLLCVLVAAGLRIERDRAELRRVLLGLAITGAAFLLLFALLNPFALLNLDEAHRQITGQSAQADTAKLGQDDTRGWLYYIGTLTWGFGWLPLIAAVAGAVLALRRDWRLALLLVAFPVCFYLYMGAQGRFFGRWLLPMYPALCVLAGYAVVTIGARRGALIAGLTALVCAQGVLAARAYRHDPGEGGHARPGAGVGPRERAGGRARRGRAVRPGLVARRARPPGVAGRAALPGVREAPARPPTSTATAGRATAG